MDTQFFIDVLTWFVKESGHPGYTNTSIPDDCPQPLLVKDPKARNNTNDPTNETVEANFEGGTYSSHPHKIHQRTHRYIVSTDRFALAMMNYSAPTLLAYGGTYANNVEMKVETILPFAFPFGVGGPTMKQRVKISHELCIQIHM